MIISLPNPSADSSASCNVRKQTEMLFFCLAEQRKVSRLCSCVSCDGRCRRRKTFFFLFHALIFLSLFVFSRKMLFGCCMRKERAREEHNIIVGKTKWRARAILLCADTRVISADYNSTWCFINSREDWVEKLTKKSKFFPQQRTCSLSNFCFFVGDKAFLANSLSSYFSSYIVDHACKSPSVILTFPKNFTDVTWMSKHTLGRFFFRMNCVLVLSSYICTIYSTRHSAEFLSKIVHFCRFQSHQHKWWHSRHDTRFLSPSIDGNNMIMLAFCEAWFDERKRERERKLNLLDRKPCSIVWKLPESFSIIFHSWTFASSPSWTNIIIL